MTPIRPKLAVLAGCVLLLASACIALPVAAAKSSPKPYKGGYYVGKTAAGNEVTLDVTPSGRFVAAVQFAFDCAAEGSTKASAQDLRIKHKAKAYRFSKSQQTHLLFPSFLSEEAQITVTGKFSSTRKVRGAFRVVSLTCGDSGDIAYSAKLKR